jgi:cytochrome c oxidase assembly factor CtaG
LPQLRDVFVPTLWGAAVPVDAGWTFAPIVLLALAAYLVIYVQRWRVSRREGGPRAAPVGRLVSWVTGIVLLFVALVSPVDRLGEQMASFHMLQHLLLADLVPICLTVGLTKHILRPVTRRIQWIERKAGPFGHPAFGVIAYATGMWVWHIPVMYEAALEHSFIHVLEHLTFAAVGLLYWWHLLSPIRSRLRLGGLGPVLYMASTKIAVGLLGIVLAFSPEVLFDFYETGGTRWGLSALDDQRVAGVLMALEQSLVMGVALVYLFIRMLQESEEEDQRAERYGTV